MDSVLDGDGSSSIVSLSTCITLTDYGFHLTKRVNLTTSLLTMNDDLKMNNRLGIQGFIVEHDF